MTDEQFFELEITDNEKHIVEEMGYKQSDDFWDYYNAIVSLRLMTKTSLIAPHDPPLAPQRLQTT